MGFRKMVLVLVFALAIAAAAPAANINITSVNYNPAPAEPGRFYTIWVNVKNTTNDQAKEVLFELEADYPFSLGEGVQARKSLGTLEAYQSITVQYDVKVAADAVNGVYALKLKTSIDSGATWRTEPYNISVLGRKPQIEIVDSTTKSARPGEIVETTLELKNYGNSSALNGLVGIQEDRTVTATGVVVERQIQPVGTSFVYFERLGPGQSTQLKIMLGVDSKADLKTYLVPITMKFQDENKQDFSQTRYIGLRVEAEPEIEAIIGAVDPEAYPGGTSDVSFDLFNAGIAEAQNTVIELAGEKEMNIFYPTGFIGSLKADDYDSFSTKVQFSPSISPGTHYITATIYYKNSSLEPRTMTKTIPIKIAAGPANNGSGAVVLAFVVIIILAVVGFFAYRNFWKPKQQKK